MLQGRNSNNYHERAEAIVELSTGSIYVGNFIWDVDTLSWIKMTASAGGSGTAYEVVGVKSINNTRINPAKEDGNLLDIKNNTAVLNTVYTTLYDDAGSNIAYVGYALPGTATSAASWRIKRLNTTNGDLVMTWADGNADFDNIWDTRNTTQEYS